MDSKINIVKTTSENKDFVNLVTALDKTLWETYPELVANYWGNNIIEFNENVVVAYLDEVAVSCACFKKYDEQTIEIKRMFVMPEMRGNRLAPMMLEVLESWAHELGFSSAVLETLYKQNAAIKMYQNAGYAIIENYEPYVGLSASICMKKRI